MKQLFTDITISAPAERVWGILTDFEQYPEWNPFVRRISGNLQPDAQLTVFLQSSGSKGMTFTPKVTHMEPNREFRWRGTLFIPGLFDGEHSFRIEPTATDAIRFIHQEHFGGILLPLLWRSIEKNTKRGFQEMNEALKQRAEQQPTER